MDVLANLKTSRALDADDQAALRAALRGPLVGPDDPGYDECRAIWNGRFDLRPAAIARCTGVADVQAVVRFAAERDLLTSIRGGGHSIRGDAMCDGGIVIDLSLMQGVIVDPAARLARVQGGVVLGQLDRETQVHGLAVPAGLVSDTGVAGLTLGGGIGFLTRQHGLTLDNLVACEVVTADGEVVTASEDDHPDLFWALRGGGSNFGVVTTFTFRAVPVGPLVYGGLAAWPVELAPEILEMVDRIGRDAPEALGLQAVIATFPAMEWIPADLHDRSVVAVSVCWNGPLAEGEALLQPFKDAHPALDAIFAMPYTVRQSLVDAFAPSWRRVFQRNGYLAGLTDEVIEVFTAEAARRESPLSVVELTLMGGAAARRPDADTAFGRRDAAYVYAVVGAWEREEDDARELAWVEDAHDALQALALRGTYTNFDGAVPEDLSTTFGAATAARLAEVKAVYDPENRFRTNYNVLPRPAGQPAT